jgi:hypothetical protein
MMHENDIKQHAADRKRIHAKHKSSRPLSNDHEYVGMAGEKALADFLGIPVDTKLRPGGDGGFDAVIGDVSIDIKTARKPVNLLVEARKVRAYIYVLAGYDDDTETAELIGWARGIDLLHVVPRDIGGHGVMSHWIPAGKLNKMDTLVDYIKEANR